MNNLIDHGLDGVVVAKYSHISTSAIPWNGVTKISHTPTFESTPTFLDGRVIHTTRTNSAKSGTIESFTALPDVEPGDVPGVSFHKKRTPVIQLAYRTRINDSNGSYKLHIFFAVSATLEEIHDESDSSFIKPSMYEYNFLAADVPLPIFHQGSTPSMTFDSSAANPVLMDQLTSRLYSESPIFPSIALLSELVEEYG